MSQVTETRWDSARLVPALGEAAALDGAAALASCLPQVLVATESEVSQHRDDDAMDSVIVLSARENA